METVLRKPGGGEAPVLMVLRHALHGDDDGVMLIAGGIMWSYQSKVGGVPEMMMACKPNEIQLHLSQRKGFVKMAIEAGATLVPCFVFGETETYNQSGPGVNKKPKKIQNCLAWISGNFKTVWQGESGELKTVCWFSKYCLLEFLNFFCIANCLIF